MNFQEKIKSIDSLILDYIIRDSVSSDNLRVSSFVSILMDRINIKHQLWLGDLILRNRTIENYSFVYAPSLQLIFDYNLFFIDKTYPMYLNGVFDAFKCKQCYVGKELIKKI